MLSSGFVYKNRAYFENKLEQTWQFDWVTDIITHGLFLEKLKTWANYGGVSFPLCLRFKLYK